MMLELVLVIVMIVWVTLLLVGRVPEDPKKEDPQPVESGERIFTSREAHIAEMENEIFGSVLSFPELEEEIQKLQAAELAELAKQTSSVQVEPEPEVEFKLVDVQKIQVAELQAVARAGSSWYQRVQLEKQAGNKRVNYGSG